MTRIRFKIDQIVLKGLQPGQDKELVASLRKELAEMLADPRTRDKWAHSRCSPVLKLGSVPLTRGAGEARQLGKKIASGIVRKLKP